MEITEQAKQYMQDMSTQGPAKAFHLFLTETCCGVGVGMKVMPKKEKAYIEVEGFSFQFDREMLMLLHGMKIDVEIVNGKRTFHIITV